MKSIREFFIRYFTRNRWETVWASRCKTHAVSMFYGDMGKVDAVAKIQVERRKNLARGVLCCMGDEQTYPIAEIALGNLGAMAVCQRENISI